MPSNLRLANLAWESLLTAHAAVNRAFAAEPIWREHGVSMREYDVLYTLAKRERRSGPQRDTAGARIGELRRGVLLSQPALSRMVDRLAARGLVERSEDSEDRRAVRVRLTDSGRELQRTVGRGHARSVARTLETALSSEELLALASVTAKLAVSAADSRTVTEEPTSQRMEDHA